MLHHASWKLTITAWFSQKIDHGHIILNIEHCGVMATKNWSSLHYTCRKFCCRNLFLTGNIGKFKPLLYGIGIFKENGMKLVYWQKIIAKMKSWCADNQKLSIAALYMQKILLQKFFFLTENFQKYWPLPYGIIKKFCMK